MKLLIKQARIVDPLSPFNGQTTDILIENGVFTRIGEQVNTEADQVIEIRNAHISPGWVDLFASFADPGYEYKETIETGSAAAAAGGFTDVFLIPNTKPVIHDKSGVEYIKQKSRHQPVNIHPLGAVTKSCEGKELAEMYDMRNSGALAFSDGLQCIQSAGLLVKALQYVKAFDGIIIQLPDDRSINPHGLMNEGIISTQLGLPGKPVMAEELMVARDIKLTRYSESRLHFTGITSRKSLEYIQRGRSGGTGVSCSVTPHHLFFCDEDLTDYNTNLKVNPPLRTRDDREALLKAVMEGLVDCIATHHLPHETDSKVTEFEYAKYGITGLETAFGVLRTALPGLELGRLIELLASNPRRIFKMDPCTIQPGAPAVISLFDPVKPWTYKTREGRSRSDNSPFDGMELTGKVIGIINKEHIFLNES